VTGSSSGGGGGGVTAPDESSTAQQRPPGAPGTPARAGGLDPTLVAFALSTLGAAGIGGGLALRRRRRP
jgi:hypothetical protein